MLFENGRPLSFFDGGELVFLSSVGLQNFFAEA
jgi:hypothetical protein